jgi:uncharacterized protein (DUF433 family)
MTTIPTDIKYIVRTPDVYGGKPRIEGHRIAVHDIAESHNMGLTPEQIVAEHYPALTVAQVYAALLYYYDHKVEIDREIDEEAADIKARAQADMSPLAQRLREQIKRRKAELERQGASASTSNTWSCLPR